MRLTASKIKTEVLKQIASNHLREDNQNCGEGNGEGNREEILLRNLAFRFLQSWKNMGGAIVDPKTVGDLKLVAGRPGSPPSDKPETAEG
jgi:hypothetical protein